MKENLRVKIPVTTLAKRPEKERQKKKNEKPSNEISKLKFCFLYMHAQVKMSLNVLLMERKACCHVANASLSRSELILLISRLKILKKKKKA